MSILASCVAKKKAERSSKFMTKERGMMRTVPPRLRGITEKEPTVRSHERNNRHGAVHVGVLL